MGCHGCDSFGHKFSPYVLLFFTILVSMWGFLKFCFLALLSGVHCHCRLINTSKVYLFVLLLCSFVEENLNASVCIRMCVCVCVLCAFVNKNEQKSCWASYTCTDALFFNNLHWKVIHIISCLGRAGKLTEKDGEAENEKKSDNDNEPKEMKSTFLLSRIILIFLSLHASVFLSIMLYYYHQLHSPATLYSLLIQGWAPICLQNCLNSSQHRYKALKTFLRDLGWCW